MRLLQSMIRLSQAHARLMYRDQVTIQDAVVAVTLMESSMQGAALLGGVNALHTAFPAYPEEEYRVQAQLILQRLDCPDLLEYELKAIDELQQNKIANMSYVKTAENTNAITCTVTFSSESKVTDLSTDLGSVNQTNCNANENDNCSETLGTEASGANKVATAHSIESLHARQLNSEGEESQKLDFDNENSQVDKQTENVLSTEPKQTQHDVNGKVKLKENVSNDDMNITNISLTDMLNSSSEANETDDSSIKDTFELPTLGLSLGHISQSQVRADGHSFNASTPAKNCIGSERHVEKDLNRNKVGKSKIRETIENRLTQVNMKEDKEQDKHVSDMKTDVSDGSRGKLVCVKQADSRNMRQKVTMKSKVKKGMQRLAASMKKKSVLQKGEDIDEDYNMIVVKPRQSKKKRNQILDSDDDEDRLIGFESSGKQNDEHTKRRKIKTQENASLPEKNICESHSNEFNSKVGISKATLSKLRNFQFDENHCSIFSSSIGSENSLSSSILSGTMWTNDKQENQVDDLCCPGVLSESDSEHNKFRVKSHVENNSPYSNSSNVDTVVKMHPSNIRRTGSECPKSNDTATAIVANITSVMNRNEKPCIKPLNTQNEISKLENPLTNNLRDGVKINDQVRDSVKAMHAKDHSTLNAVSSPSWLLSLNKKFSSSNVPVSLPNTLVYQDGLIGAICVKNGSSKTRACDIDNRGKAVVTNSGVPQLSRKSNSQQQRQGASVVVPSSIFSVNDGEIDFDDL